MAPGVAGGLPWAELPPITWGVAIFIVSNIFYGGMNYMRMRQLERLIRGLRKAHARHVKNRKLHALDAEADRRRIAYHDRLLTRITPSDVMRDVSEES